MPKKRSQTRDKTFVEKRLARVNRILGKLEGEFEHAVKRVIAKGERSSGDLRKNFDEILDWVKTGNLYAIASGTKDNFETEIARLKTEALDRIRDLEALNPQGFFSEVKQGLSGFVEKIQETSLFEEVRVQAEKSRGQLLQVLNLPDRKNFDHVSDKVTRLEKKLQALSKRAA